MSLKSLAGYADKNQEFTSEKILGKDIYFFVKKTHIVLN